MTVNTYYFFAFIFAFYLIYRHKVKLQTEHGSLFIGINQYWYNKFSQVQRAISPGAFFCSCLHFLSSVMLTCMVQNV